MVAQVKQAATQLLASGAPIENERDAHKVLRAQQETAADYGLPDLNDMRLSLHDARGQVCRAIQASIEAYEPRLRNVCVVSAPNDADQLRLSFRIDAFLEVEGFRGAVSFFACLDGNGQIKVIQG
ncbi:type VI secretion system baseplate subunit TssE [Pseudomonas sp. FP198]|nr:type VI secretion system baseplate subunit TssE [Pseudomonas sp. FP198]WLG98509.1 type VI secretion system baseplate subunit TssE [Pseudomonas sp. FP198]